VPDLDDLVSERDVGSYQHVAIGRGILRLRHRRHPHCTSTAGWQ
jgi:hypothetical protein